MPCPATFLTGARAGQVCGKNGFYFENHCGTHFNSKLNHDLEFRARYQAHMVAEQMANNARIAEAEAHRLAEQQRVQAERQEKIDRNLRRIEEAPQSSIQNISLFLSRLMRLWTTERIPGWDIPKSYVAAKYLPVGNANFPTLIRAIMKVCLQANGYHHEHSMYTSVPAEERQTALTELSTALQPYGEIDMTLMALTDKHYQNVRERIAQEEAARLAAAAAAAEAIRAAEFEQQLRNNPVVFRRDPEGSIDLRAFGADGQSVHRSSVQLATQAAIAELLKRPMGEGQDTLAEIVADFSKTTIVRFSSQNVKERAILELTNDYFNTEAFSTMYGDVLDRVWAYMRSHTERVELTIRLAQEVVEGIQQCVNGKMARLINSLQGYDETLQIELDPRDRFQSRFAQLRNAPLNDRMTAANSLFEEFHIPDEERVGWLNALMEEV